MTGVDVVERTVEVDGRPVRILERGSGTVATVLLHGGMAGHGPWHGAADLWRPLMEAMGPRGRVIAIDLPGCGGSPIADAVELTIAGATDRVGATLRALGVEVAVPVGHGEASLVALLLARRPPEGLSVGGAAVIAATGAAPTSDGVSPVVLLNPPTAQGAAARSRWELDRLSSSAAHVTDDTVNALARHADGPARASAAQALSHPEAAIRLTTDLLGAKMDFFAHCRDTGYDVPISILWGSHDPLLTVAHGDGLFALLSTTNEELDFNVLGRTGHLPFREDPRAVLRILEPFASRSTRRWEVAR
jgi:pimeloyl-ACP methyl ester carboxylesterase